MRVASIGLGRMGRPIAARLTAAGHQVTGFDASPEARAGAGIEVAESAAKAAAGAEVVLLCLPDAGAVRRVARDLPEVPLLVDLSSSLPAVTRELRGRVVDAPMSGGVAGAEAGTLTIMAGGDPDLVDAARPVLEAFAERIFHAGRLGSGHAAKALNNALSALALVATSEAVVTARWAAHSAEG